MGRAWFESSAEAARTFGAADEILGDRLGDKLSTLCFEGPESSLNRTDVAQPALFVAGVASYQAMFAESGPGSLAGAAGLSLGEYTALHIAGAISFAEALELVALRGRAMQDAAEASQSSMLALVGADEDKANELCARASEGDVLVPANFNAPGQVVLSGSVQAIERAESAAGDMGLRATRLAVAGAFHSPFMEPAAERLGEQLATTTIAEPSCPVLSNVTGEPHIDADSIRARLVEQLTAPVRWSACCTWLGANARGASFDELAPGKVLAGLMRRIDRALKVQSHDEPQQVA